MGAGDLLLKGSEKLWGVFSFDQKTKQEIQRNELFVIQEKILTKLRREHFQNIEHNCPLCSEPAEYHLLSNKKYFWCKNCKDFSISLEAESIFFDKTTEEQREQLSASAVYSYNEYHVYPLLRDNRGRLDIYMTDTLQIESKHKNNRKDDELGNILSYTWHN